MKPSVWQDAKISDQAGDGIVCGVSPIRGIEAISPAGGEEDAVNARFWIKDKIQPGNILIAIKFINERFGVILVCCELFFERGSCLCVHKTTSAGINWIAKNIPFFQGTHILLWPGCHFTPYRLLRAQPQDGIRNSMVSIAGEVCHTGDHRIAAWWKIKRKGRRFWKDERVARDHLAGG